MADPTQAARDKVGTFLKDLLPANSPLNKSVEAGNPSVLTAEAQKKRAEADALEAQAINTTQAVPSRQPSQEAEFVSPALSQPEATQKIPQSNILGMYDKAANQAIAADEKLGKEQGAVLSAQQKLVEDTAKAQQEAELKKEQDVKLINDDISKAQNDLDSTKIEPHGFFHNKSTWQKIVGGIGLFLGSLTPEGARNIAGIIDKEIERDTDSQKQDYALKKGKVDALTNRYKLYLDKYKDDQLARLAMSKEKLLAGDYQLKSLESKAKGEATRSKIGMGRVEIAASIEDRNQKMLERMSKINQPNKTAAKGLLDMEASADTVKSSLNDLSQLVKGTGEAIPFTEKNDRAKQLVNDIQLQLKEIKKLGVLSGSDDARLDNYLGDPSFFKTDSRMQGQIKGVMDLVNKALNAQRKALGAKDPNAVQGFKPKA